MSYDLTFVPRSAGQPWADAIDAANDVAGRPDARAWREICGAVRQILGDIELFEGDGWYELTHEATAIQVSLYAGEAGIAVPAWHAGKDAERVLAVLYQIGAVVEAATGFAGYDPQADLPIAAAGQVGVGVSMFDRAAALFASLPRTAPPS